jgi:deoxyribonuclease-4
MATKRKAAKKKAGKAAKKPARQPTKKPAKKPTKKLTKKSAPRRATTKAPAPYPPEQAAADASGDRAPLGAHVSTAGGVATAPPRAVEIGASAIQIFTKVPNQWKEKEISPAEAAAFREGLTHTGVRFTASHDSYLINLATPDATLRERSVESFTNEVRRCNALGLDALVSHPGNFIDDRASGIARNAEGITRALEAAPGPTRLLMELTAGQGTVIGSTFEEMAELLDRIAPAQRGRVGVCLDTAHVFAAGYDLIGDYDGVWARFDDLLGLAKLGLVHLNDSQAPLGAKKDRHALIGAGCIGDAPFRRIMQDPRLDRVPKVLETPKGDDMVTNDREMLRKLRAFARA